MPRNSFSVQLNSGGRRKSELMPTTEEQQMQLAGEIEDTIDVAAAPFESKFKPHDMRQLALVAHNHMKPAMKEFITTYSEVLKKFRITGTQTTMRMCRSLWGEDDPDVQYGLTCTSGPLGGDAQIAALMCMEDLGALIFFIDPLSAHPHQADIDSLVRLANCGNIIVCPNPTSAMSMIHTLRRALETGNRGLIPSFFSTLESPAVAEYKSAQEIALATAVAGGGAAVQRPPMGVDPSMRFDRPAPGAQISGPAPGVDASTVFTTSALAAVDASSHLWGLDDTGHGTIEEGSDEEGSDVDDEELEETTKEFRRASFTGPPTTRPNRSSALSLAGIKIEDKKKMKATRKLMRKITKSISKRFS